MPNYYVQISDVLCLRLELFTQYRVILKGFKKRKTEVSEEVWYQKKSKSSSYSTNGSVRLVVVVQKRFY